MLLSAPPTSPAIAPTAVPIPGRIAVPAKAPPSAASSVPPIFPPTERLCPAVIIPEAAIPNPGSAEPAVPSAVLNPAGSVLIPESAVAALLASAAAPIAIVDSLPVARPRPSAAAPAANGLAALRILPSGETGAVDPPAPPAEGLPDPPNGLRFPKN